MYTKSASTTTPITIRHPTMNRFAPNGTSKPLTCIPSLKRYEEAIDHAPNITKIHSFQAFGRKSAATAASCTNAPTISVSLNSSTLPSSLGRINAEITSQVPNNNDSRSGQRLFMFLCVFTSIIHLLSRLQYAHTFYRILCNVLATARRLHEQSITSGLCDFEFCYITR